VLGNGVDFFIPKPKSLRYLGKYVLDICNADSNCVKECVILSNCARLDVLLVVEHQQEEQEQPPLRLLQSISSCFITQMEYYRDRQRQNQLWKQSLLNMIDNDRPNDVFTGARASASAATAAAAVAGSYWSVYRDAQALPYLCEVVAGIAPRPNRPPQEGQPREVVFRPFSSRDAHIMLQIKRTKDTIVVEDAPENGQLQQQQKRVNSSSNSTNVLSKLLEYTIRVGRAVRNVQAVPELQSLRCDPYLRSSSTVTKQELLHNQRVVNITYAKAVQPLIDEYNAQHTAVTAMGRRQIVSLRDRAYTVLHEYIHSANATTQDDRTNEQQQQHVGPWKQWLNRKLHEPTMELRTYGRYVTFQNEDDCIQHIREELELQRSTICIEILEHK
jgi:hypothetical protein